MADEVEALRDEVATLRALLRPFAEYARAREHQPLPDLGNVVHAIHTGTAYEGILRWSDCQMVLRYLDGRPGADPDKPITVGGFPPLRVRMIKVAGKPHRIGIFALPFGADEQQVCEMDMGCTDPLTLARLFATSPELLAFAKELLRTVISESDGMKEACGRFVDLKRKVRGIIAGMEVRRGPPA